MRRLSIGPNGAPTMDHLVAGQDLGHLGAGQDFGHLGGGRAMGHLGAGQDFGHLGAGQEMARAMSHAMSVNGGHQMGC